MASITRPAIRKRIAAMVKGPKPSIATRIAR
jgi:hypothetical protein